MRVAGPDSLFSKGFSFSIPDLGFICLRDPQGRDRGDADEHDLHWHWGQLLGQRIPR